MTQKFYAELAKYYDRIYHYIDYKKQVQFFMKLISKYNTSSNKKILDIACGTGIHADILQKEGFEVTGIDISSEMLAEAKKKNSKIKLIQKDMKKFDLSERFGCIICFFNSILYNKNEKEMKAALSNFYNHLENGGILIFDVVDKSIGIKSKKEEYEYEDENLKILFKPQWIFNKEKNVMDLDIDFIINNEKLHDHHVMGAFSFDELKRITENQGFKVKIFERDFENFKERHNKKTAIFLCKK